jgi:endonuclease/exonuclease/phosphatase family metal-dependent hydrolase
MRLLRALLPMLAIAGCATRVPPMTARADVEAAPPACRTRVTGVRWIAPEPARDRSRLDRWCAATGPPVVLAPSPGSIHPPAELVVVSWNLQVGAADLDALIGRLRDGAFSDGQPVRRFVLLLQEGHRGGADVPTMLTAAAQVPRPIRPANRPPDNDLMAVARRQQLALFYVPSMRNGAPSATEEDRGNAILSTEPLTGLTAIELPFERQRRVAVAATIDLAGAGGREPLRLVSLHLEAVSSAKVLWLFGRARPRQIGALLAALPAAGALVVGGDFNTWFGHADLTYRRMAKALPDVVATDRRPTFALRRRLDHVFARLPAGWTAADQRLDQRFGSDHHPVLVQLRGPGGGARQPVRY